MIYVSKMSDAGVDTLFHKDTCKMVRGVMVLMKGVWIGTLYKLLGNVNLIGCNNNIVPKVDSTHIRLSRFKLTRQVFINLTQPFYGTRGWDTLEKKDFELCETKVWLKVL
jgi:hypothetical protein